MKTVNFVVVICWFCTSFISGQSNNTCADNDSRHWYWPEGSYAILQTRNGCPGGVTSEWNPWKVGYRCHDTERTKDMRSDQHHAAGGDGTIRLVGGSHGSEGRVEVFYGGSWGTVCNNGFSSTDAAVVCKQLGRSGGTVSSFGPGTGQIWLDNVGCGQSHERLHDCPHAGWGVHSCTHDQDVGVTCGVLWSKDSYHRMYPTSWSWGTSLSVPECQARCLQQDGCLSTTYSQYQTAKYCHGNDRNKATAPDEDFYQSTGGYDYYEWHQDADYITTSVTGIEARTLRFCGSAWSAEEDRPGWPAGTYCVFRKGGACPAGFKSGSIFFDDQDSFWHPSYEVNDNEWRYYVPDGVYGMDTLYNFCCREDSPTTTPITLPHHTTRDFYLFPLHGHDCQEVEHASVQLEFIQLDSEDTKNMNHWKYPHPHDDEKDTGGDNHRIHLCYYSFPRHDECSEGTSLCEHNCHDTVGSYYCTCNEGFILGEDGHSCTALCGTTSKNPCGFLDITEEECELLSCCYNTEEQACYKKSDNAYLAYEGKVPTEMEGRICTYMRRTKDECTYECDVKYAGQCKAFVLQYGAGEDNAVYDCHLLQHSLRYYIDNELLDEDADYKFYNPLLN